MFTFLFIFLSILVLANITIIEDYIGKVLNITTYKLKEKDPEGDILIISVYGYEGEIVGSIGEVTNYTPGMFNPSDKKDLEDVLRDQGNFQEDQIKN
ncbi:hypothetical protein [Lysinibacillus xylanilyticus]|uniref:Uncharacterized protein n=1 Tax=Lysinibacillus xylanilyticus TaxID=582475 RepID=A0A2M9Q4D2_9BACI|nr:hypothetical protein [Lysinibacillus xylanilyticus]PJO42931.1 hypothetical protein CWD94_14235 [Lysinibacillus xylanilyticus]